MQRGTKGIVVSMDDNDKRLVENGVIDLEEGKEYTVLEVTPDLISINVTQCDGKCVGYYMYRHQLKEV